MRQNRRPYREPLDGEDTVGGELAAVKERLESLTRHLERMARANSDPNTPGHGDADADQLSNAMARLDRRLDQIVAEESHDSTHEFYRRGLYAPYAAQPTPQPAANPRLAQNSHQNPVTASWAAQIAARQRALDAAHAAAATPTGGMPRPADPPPSHWDAQVAARQRALAESSSSAEPAYDMKASAPSYGAAPSAPFYSEAAHPSPYSAAARSHSYEASAPPASSYASSVRSQAMPTTARPPAAPAQPNWGSYFSRLQDQLHQLNEQVSSLHQPYENAIGALRNDLANIGRTLTDAMPHRAIEALEDEVRSLGDRIELIRNNSTHSAALGALRNELAEVRNALPRFDVAEGFGAHSAALGALRSDLAEIRNVLPRFDVAEGFGHVGQALHDLHHKVDHVASLSQTAQIDPTAFKQLEQAVGALRGSHVASEITFAQIAAEVRHIGTTIDRLGAESGGEALGRLEARIASLIESGLAAQPDVADSIRELSERLNHQMQLSHSDQLALGALEDRIANLSGKLDTSDAQLGHLEAIERGLADLLVHLEEVRNGNGGPLRAAVAEPAPAPMPPRAAPAVSAPTPTPTHAPSALDLLLPQTPLPQPAHPPGAEAALPPAQPQQRQLQPLAPRAAPVDVEPAPQPVPARPPAARSMPRAPQRQPIDPNLPPDTPLEPGSGAPRIKPGSAAARIAASEAALGNARPATLETGGKSAAIAAARNAVKAANHETPAKAAKPREGVRKWMPWPFNRAAKELAPAPQAHAPSPPPMLPPMPQAMPPAASRASTVPPPPLPFDDSADAAPPARNKALKVLKNVLVAVSVAIIFAGVAQVGMEYLFPAQTPAFPPKDQSQSPAELRVQAPTTAPSWPAPAPAPSTAPSAAPEQPQPASPTADPDSTNSSGRSSSLFDPSTAMKVPDVTGSVSSGAPMPSAAPAGNAGTEMLPPSISPALRVAVAANDPAAEYEMGLRYAEGRGVPQSVPEAVRWLEMAADGGFAPAQFRLGSLNEKGEGLRKDIKAAQRLYLAAALKGHAKAMHNLAVLYAEGIDGKPDYKAASEWFRKAAGYGVTDSQYNLAILFARGIGVQTNLVESYRWFALAAANGDTDAAKKRDEIASRLDPTTLATAKLSVQAFIPEREPDEATNLRIPQGGWDSPGTAPAKPRRRSTASASR